MPRLTREKVVELRRRRAAGERLIDLASAFGVSPPVAHNAIRGRTYAGVPGALDPPADSPADVVYVVRCSGSGRFTIGTSADFEARFSDLQAGAPCPLEVVALLVGGRSLERRLHVQLERYRLHGEWFEAAPEVEAVVHAASADLRTVGSRTGRSVHAVPRRSPGGRTSRVTEEDIRTILGMRRWGHTYGEIASKLGISASHACLIATGRWRPAIVGHERKR